VNWRDFDTGEPGLPEEDDDVWLQTGNVTNSILYGLPRISDQKVSRLQQSMCRWWWMT
jgi:hypothetical protein